MFTLWGGPYHGRGLDSATGTTLSFRVGRWSGRYIKRVWYSNL